MSSPIIKLPQVPKDLDPELRDYLLNINKILIGKQNEEYADVQKTKSSVDNLQNYNERSGSIVEYLTSVCDGSTVKGIETEYVWPEVTTQQPLTLTHQDITGSSIAYTPPKEASKVLYRFLFKGVRDTQLQLPACHFKLIFDDSEIKAARTTITASYIEQQHSIEWVLDSWEGSKIIKLQGRVYSSSFPGQLHNIQDWDGAVVTSFQPPILTIIAIR